MHQQPSAPETTLAQEYQRLLALLDERRFDEAQVRARVMLESGEVGDLLRARTHNLLCWTFIEGIKHATPESVLHGEEAVRIAAGVGERGLQVQAMCNLASAYHQVGDYDLARQTYREILIHLEREPDLVPCGMVLANLGLSQLDLCMNRLESALEHLRTAARFCEAGEGRFMRPDLYRRQALVLLKLGRTEEAAQCIDLLDESSYASGPRSLWWKTHLAFSRARVELARGHWGQARTLAVTAAALARELGDMPVLAEATCIQALLDQAEGRKEAPRKARRALSFAIHSGRRDVVTEVRERLKDLLAFEI